MPPDPWTSAPATVPGACRLCGSGPTTTCDWGCPGDREEVRLYTDEGEAHRAKQRTFNCTRCFHPSILPLDDDGGRTLTFASPACPVCNGTGVMP